METWSTTQNWAPDFHHRWVCDQEKLCILPSSPDNNRLSITWVPNTCRIEIWGIVFQWFEVLQICPSNMTVYLVPNFPDIWEWGKCDQKLVIHLSKTYHAAIRFPCRLATERLKHLKVGEIHCGPSPELGLRLPSVLFMSASSTSADQENRVIIFGKLSSFSKVYSMEVFSMFSDGLLLSGTVRILRSRNFWMCPNWGPWSFNNSHFDPVKHVARKKLSHSTPHLSTLPFLFLILASLQEGVLTPFKRTHTRKVTVSSSVCTALYTICEQWIQIKW